MEEQRRQQRGGLANESERERARERGGGARRGGSQSWNGKAVRLLGEVAGVRDGAESGLAGSASVGATEWSIERATEVPLALVVACPG